MAKQILILGFYFSLITLLLACDGEEILVPAPKVSFPFNAPSAIEFNEAIKFTIKIVAKTKLSKITVKKNGIEMLPPKTSGFTNDTLDQYEFSYNAQTEDEGKTINFTFEVFDQKDQLAIGSYTVVVGGNFDIRSGITINNQADLAKLSFYSISEDRTYNFNDSKANAGKIDWAYATTSTIGSKQVLGALNDELLKAGYNYNWISPKSTKFFLTEKKTIDYQNIKTLANLKDFFSTASDSRINADALTGKVVGIIFPDGKKAVMLISSATSTNISFEIKLEE